MPVTKENLDDVFTYHSPTPDQIPKYQAIRASGHVLAETILESTPSCADQQCRMKEHPVTKTAPRCTCGRVGINDGYNSWICPRCGSWVAQVERVGRSGPEPTAEFKGEQRAGRNERIGDVPVNAEHKETEHSKRHNNPE